MQRVQFTSFCLSMALLSVCSFEAPADPGESNRVLASLKSSILEYALDNKAHVSANSWISSSGAIKEELLVYNRLKLDKLRFQTFDYGKGDRGSRLFGVGNQSESKKRFISRDSEGSSRLACDLPSVRKQRVLMFVETPESSDSISLNLAGHANKVFLDSIRTAKAHSVLGEDVVIYEENRRKSQYESYYTGNYQGPSDMRLEVSSSASRMSVKRVFKNSVRPWKKAPETYLVETKVSLIALNGDELWTNIRYSRVSAQESQVLLTHLSDSTVADLRAWSGSLFPVIAEQAQCHGSIALSMINGRVGDGSIVGGRDVGVFKGQKFLLAPKEDRLSLEGLEQGLKMISLAEVVDVFENSAAISVYAGISDLNYDDMLAIPLSHAGIFEG